MADSKLSALTEITSPALTDNFYIVASGIVPDRKVTLGNVRTTMSVPTIYESVYASPPASPADGDNWLITDSNLSAHRTSGSWSYYGTTYKVNLPPTSGWSWVNQGTSTLTDTGNLVIYTPANSSSNTRSRVITAPSLPYTIDAIFMTSAMQQNWQGAGLLWRDSGTGKQVTFMITTIVSNLSYNVFKWSSATAQVASYINLDPVYRPIPLILRISEDSSNRTCYFSQDGGNSFYQFHQVGRTDYMTADQVGFCTYEENATYPISINLLSWKQT